MNLDQWIEVLKIFRKYGNPNNALCQSHDEIQVMIDPKLVSKEDREILYELDFFNWGNEAFATFV